MIESPNTVHGRLLEAVHISGYTVERAFSELKWLLKDDRWKTVGDGFDDVDEFLATVSVSSFKIAVEQRKELVKELALMRASQSATAKALGVSEPTVARDLGKTRGATNVGTATKKAKGPTADPSPNPTNVALPEQPQSPEAPSPPPAVEPWFSSVNPTDFARHAEGKQKSAETKVANEATRATKVVLPDGKFDSIVIDPPWDIEKIKRDVRPNQVAFDYPIMSEDELVAYGAEVAARSADDCHLFMWTTQKYLPFAISTLLPAWGYRYVCLFTWHKPGGFQPIGLPQYNSEFVIYARKGTPKFIDTKAFPTCFEAERREHSRKPDCFYETVARVTDGRRADWFARGPRDGFVVIGNELQRFPDVDI